LLRSEHPHNIDYQKYPMSSAMHSLIHFLRFGEIP